jgi:hypothetical protein
VNIESELREVLQRTDPPAGFAQRVIERCGGQPSGWPVPARGPAPTRFHALAAAALIAVALGGWGVHVAIRARNEILIAMRIASQKVAHAQREVRQVSR